MRYLREARDLGDLLIVAVNSDTSTRRLKGPTRPIIGEDERAETLAALIAVDYVTIFADATAERLVQPAAPRYLRQGSRLCGCADTRERTLLLTPEELRRVVAGQATDHAGLAGLAERMPEARAVAEYGGSLALIAYLPGHSTSELIARIVRSAQQESGVSHRSLKR